MCDILSNESLSETPTTTPRPMSDDTKAIISGTVRTLAQLVPVAGGAIAQAWSEYETINQSRRTESFFTELREHLQRLESHQADLSSRIASMPDAAELLERAVSAARRETNDAKRQVFSRLYSSFLGKPQATTPDERLDLIHHVEQLTEKDLSILAKFAQCGGTLRGDVLTGTVNSGWSSVGRREPDANWLQLHGETVHSIAKLESRSLIHRVTVNAGFFESGDSGSSFNVFRRKSWGITPIGSKLLAGIAAPR